MIGDILTYYGTILEPTTDDGIVFLAPQNLKSALGIPEYGKLKFSYDSSQMTEEIIPAFYGSDLFKAIEEFLVDKGQITIADYPAFIPNIEKLVPIVSRALGFSNATFRMEPQETTAPITYLLVFFKYLALSDEKQEGLIPILINTINSSTLLLDEGLFPITGIIENLTAHPREPVLAREKAIQMIAKAHSAASAAVQERLRDFSKSLERRLNRDIKRVYEYYGTLKDELLKLIEKKILSGEYTIENIPKDKLEENLPDIGNHITQKKVKGDGMDKLLSKLEAIAGEQQAKIQDLLAKYTLTIDIEPVVTIGIETQSVIFGLDIRRRALSRRFPLTYNPLLKRMDPLPCESCFSPRGTYFVCDDRLHVICSNCFTDCPRCAKKYCKACYPKGCPKCQRP